MTLIRLLQLSDSAFPSGGFTHSSGMEAAAHHGDVASVEDVERIVRIAVRQAAMGLAPLLLAAYRDPVQLPALDARADLFLNQPVGNRASRAQGLALLAAAARVFPDAGLDVVADRVRTTPLHGHHAPIFGVVMRALGVDADEAGRLFLFQSARTPAAAAVRLGVIGAFDGQRVQTLMEPAIEPALAACRDLGPDDIVQTAPVLDLLQSTQDRLYSRLFQS